MSSEPESGEDLIIARYFKPLATHPGALNLTDDAALLAPPPGHELVLTVDAIVGGVHFFPDDPPDTIARKALRVNLSDLAAKGATPAGCLLTLALPEHIDGAWLEAFARGLGEDTADYKCPLLGGDSVRTPGPVTVSIAAFGILPQGTMVMRSGARAGDRVFVTGTIGDAALGLALRQEPAQARAWRLDAAMEAHLLGRYRLPQPRNALAEAMRANVSGGMDVSDGLAGDLTKLCRASGVAAEIELARVPLSAAAKVAIGADPKLIQTVLSGGDDYEILGTAAPEQLAALEAAGKAAGIPVTEIGRVVEGQGARFLDDSGKPLVLEKLSFSHF